jgi:hypothetical protein
MPEQHASVRGQCVDIVQDPRQVGLNVIESFKDFIQVRFDRRKVPSFVQDALQNRGNVSLEPIQPGEDRRNVRYKRGRFRIHEVLPLSRVLQKVSHDSHSCGSLRGHEIVDVSSPLPVVGPELFPNSVELAPEYLRAAGSFVGHGFQQRRACSSVSASLLLMAPLYLPLQPLQLELLLQNGRPKHACTGPHRIDVDGFRGDIVFAVYVAIDDDRNLVLFRRGAVSSRKDARAC